MLSLVSACKIKFETVTRSYYLTIYSELKFPYSTRCIMKHTLRMFDKYELRTGDWSWVYISRSKLTGRQEKLEDRNARWKQSKKENLVTLKRAGGEWNEEEGAVAIGYKPLVNSAWRVDINWTVLTTFIHPLTSYILLYPYYRLSLLLVVNSTSSSVGWYTRRCIEPENA